MVYNLVDHAIRHGCEGGIVDVDLSITGVNASKLCTDVRCSPNPCTTVRPIEIERDWRE